MTASGARDPLRDDVRAFAANFEEWLGSQPSVLSAVARPIASYDQRVAATSELMRVLFDAGWVRYGWPTEVGGLGATAVRLDEAAPPRYDEVVKVLAGRNGRRVCERTLQVLGAVGFTTEHSHHHHYSRVLALDSLLGTSADLAHALGGWVRQTQADPALPAAALLPGLDS